jgi:prevent-host-death family protein
MLIASTELKKHLGKFLKLSEKEDIIILKRGKPVAKLQAIKREEEAPITKTLTGVLKTVKIDLKSERSERLKKYEGSR